MRIHFIETPTGRTANVHVHGLVLKHQPDKVAEFAVRLMKDTGVDSVTVIPS